MLLAALLTFAALFLGIMAVYLTIDAARHSPEAELKKRLRRMEKNVTGDGTADGTNGLLKVVSPAERLMSQLPLLRNLQMLVAQSGVGVAPLRVLLAMVMVAAAGFLSMYFLRHDLASALLTAALITALPVLYLQQRKSKRERQFIEQLPDALTMVARSLRAGHSLTDAIDLIGQELAEPAGGLFRIAHEQQKLGMRITDALEKLLETMAIIDLRFFVTIVKINYDTGGNLAEILEKLAETIRSRLQIRRQVRVYSAQGRLSGYILAALPVALFVTLYLLLPGYLDVFFKDQKSQYILAGAVFAEMIGYLFIRKIVNIRI